MGALALSMTAQAATVGGLPRHPDLSGDTVVFTAGGDLWTVSVDGGTARRLTSHPGTERFARVSPDGEWVAYTAEYDGDSNVWVVPMEGGEPRRLTWHAMWWGDDLVWDWTPDGDEVLFASRYRTPQQRYMELFAVSVDGGLPRAMPTSDVGPTTMGADGTLVFNRYFRNFRTWKRYRGGSQQDLWRMDPATNKGERITSFEGTDTHPMIADDGAIYFVSDRPEGADGSYARRNLFKWVSETEAEQLTQHADFDVDWPALDGDRIVYMLGGELRVLELSTGEDRALDLTIPDEAHEARPHHADVSGEWDALSVGPQAKRVAVVAHGDLFTVPTEEGAARLVQGGSDGRIGEVAWSPDGKQLAYVSDVSGEQELWLVDQSGAGEPRKLTSGNTTWFRSLGWSADSKRLFYTDKRMRLWDVDAASGTKTLVDTGVAGEISEASYSRDGSWMTYVRADDNGYGAIWLYDVRGRRTVRVTSDFNADSSPAFDPDGRYLYFTSARNFDLVGDTFEWRYVHRLTDLLYVVRLTDAADDPLAPRSDEEVDDAGKLVLDETEDDKASKRQAKKEARKKKNNVVVDAPSLKVDVDGLMDRVQRLPVSPGKYGGLAATSDGVFFSSYPGISGAGEPSLMFYSLEDQESKTSATGIVGFELAANGEKMLAYNTMGQLGILPAQAEGASFSAFDVSGLRTWVEPRLEWAQALDEVRRYEREFFYDPNMHGKDWDGLHDRYAALLDRASSTSDVHWLIGEYIGELNAGHAYVSKPGPGLPYEGVGYLGADLDAADGGVRITRIFDGEPGDPRRTSPLRAPGVDVDEGDFLVAVDGRELGERDNPYQWLVGTAGRPVRLHVNARPSMDGAREVTVVPIGSEGQLRYWDQVEENRRKVAEATDGRVGYVHVPNTSTEGYTEFLRGLLAQSRMDGLVIDVRYNGGGFIPEMFIEHLLRPHYNSWVPRDGIDWRTPDVAMHGPKVCLTNGYAGSGGDAFPYYFKQFGLGKTVGTTTWGGLVGIDNGLGLLIGGGVTAPSFAFVNRDGEWDVERIGVPPDIFVENPPEAAHLGEDPQLDAAICQVLEELETWVDPVPPRPSTFPVRP